MLVTLPVNSPILSPSIVFLLHPNRYNTEPRWRPDVRRAIVDDPYDRCRNRGGGEMPDVADFPRFSAEEMASRHAKVQALLDENNLDAMLLYATGRFSDVYWLTDWPGSREAYVLFQRGADPVVLA